jgi:ubiquinone/menaquinone biosynthesis C-methylase UbiE
MKANPLEFMRRKDIISRYLESDNMSILDIGGATGAFSFWLAEQGHDVSLIDFVDKHIEIARQHEIDKGIRLTSAVVGDARELPFEDNTFDLVLLMGSLYHLTNKSDRLKSLEEAYRVLKPNGRIVCETISRYASMFDGFIFGLVDDPEFIPILQRDIKTGCHKDTSSSKKYFTDGHFHHPEELVNELQEARFVFEDIIAVTSFANAIQGIKSKLEDVNYLNTLLDTIKLVEKEPSLMGISSHYMGIGKKG